MANNDKNTIPLKEPVTVTIGEEETKVTSLTFRKPKAKDYRVRDRAAGDVDATIRLIAALSGQDVQVIDELGSDDFNAASEKVAGFMGASPKTGQT